jgi:hypothetical protein
MASSKITGLAELAATPASTDMLVLVDVSDTSMAATGTDKKIAASRFLSTNGTANTLGATLNANSNHITNVGTIGIGTATIVRANITNLSAGTLVANLNANNYSISSVAGLTTSTLSVSSGASFGGTVGVTGAVTLASTLGVTGATTLGSVNTGDVVTTGNNTISGTLTVSGAATVNTSFNVSGGLGLTNMQGYTLYMNRTSANYIWATGVGGYWAVGVNGNTIGTATASILITADNNVSVKDNFQAGSLGTSWAALTFNTGWANFGGSNGNAQYKKVGDLVFLRGLITRSSGSETVIGTLPEGFRPPAAYYYTTASDSGYGRLHITSAGQVIYGAGGLTWFSLSGIVFSTTS